MIRYDMGVNPEEIEVIKLAADVLKQMVTLSSALLALSVTLAGQIAKHVTQSDFKMIKAVWSSLLACTVFAMWGLFALTGTLAKLTTSEEGIYGWNVVIPTACSIVAFIVAMGLLIKVGVKALGNTTKENSN